MKFGKRRIENIFQDCLEALQQGEDLDEVLGRYPEHAQALRKRLETVLWLKESGEVLASRANYIPAARQRLINRTTWERSAEATRPLNLHSLKAYRQKRFWLALNLAALSLLVVVLGFVGTQLYAYAETALPGDTLYPAKLFLEKTRLEFAQDPVARARLHVEFATLRSSEIVELIFEGRFEDLMATSLNLQYHVQQANHLLKGLKSSDPSLAQGLSDQLESTFDSQNLLLDLLIQSVPYNSRGGIEIAMTLVAQ